MDEPAHFTQNQNPQQKRKREDDRIGHERDIFVNANGMALSSGDAYCMDIYTYIHIHKHHHNVK